MLTCEQALELISAQLDGALTAEEAGRWTSTWPSARRAGRFGPTSPPCTSFCPLWRRSPPPG